MNLKDVSYVGIFVEHMQGELSKDIPNQHITLAYKPNEEVFNELLRHLGEEYQISIIGYGNDGKNEGLLVEIPENIPYYGAEQKHITLSINTTSSAVKTGFIKFDKEMPDALKDIASSGLTGRIAVFTKEKELVYDGSAFEEFEKNKTIADMVLEDDYKLGDETTESSEEPVRNMKNKEATENMEIW